MKITRILANAAVAVAVAAGVVIPATAAQAADTALGIDVGNIAYKQLYTDNADVKLRRYETGSNCNFYTGFWADPNNDRHDNTSASTCGKSSKGYEYRDGTKSWVTVNWRARAWCADFAKFAFYWGTAKYTGLNALAASFKTYGVNNGTWHPKGSYVPRKGDAVVYDWEGDGIIDHVGIVTSFHETSVDGTFNSVEGNRSNEVRHVLNTSNRAASVVGFTSPASR
ncbi:CHAP domain-containing protein [Micromonospora sp. CPCC 205561]|uniref:CHAP domain-containing protein n=1 Tax=Micromonospora sp. CPCC 205561 TaxID=3122407 RepID=UPI002FF33B4A